MVQRGWGDVHERSAIDRVEAGLSRQILSTPRCYITKTTGGVGLLGMDGPPRFVRRDRCGRASRTRNQFDAKLARRLATGGENHRNKRSGTSRVGHALNQEPPPYRPISSLVSGCHSRYIDLSAFVRSRLVWTLFLFFFILSPVPTPVHGMRTQR